jgi:serine/threonine-protein kinase
VVETRFNEYEPAFSPDGRWLAYVSDESGRPEVYVRDFPDGATWSISTDGGTEPVWARDATKLYYRNGPRMMAVSIRAVSGSSGPSFSASRPELLFEGDFRIYNEIPGFPAYDVAPNGERFLMNRTLRVTDSGDVHVVLDWFEELERRVP